MKRILPNITDIQTFGLGLRSFPGAFGTGYFDDPIPDLSLSGALWGWLPCQKNEIIEYGKTLLRPGNDSFFEELHNFEKFYLSIDAYKFRRFLIFDLWIGSFTLTLGQTPKMKEIRGVRHFFAPTLPSFFSQVRKFKIYCEPPPPIPIGIQNALIQ